MPIKKVIIDKANRLYQLPPELDSIIPRRKKRGLLKKSELIDLSSFNWPIEFDKDINEDFDFSPASSDKLTELKDELAGWFNSYHDVKIIPEKEIFIGAGISGILFNLSMAFVDNGDIVFVPEIGVPLYKKVTAACGGQPVNYSVSHKNDWLPDFEKVNSRLGRVARLLYLNNPHNPTGAELSEKELENLIWIAARENITVVNDAAYQALSSRKQTSLLTIKGGKKVGIEVYSFPYQFGLPSFPFGFAVGNKEVINGLKSAAKINNPFIPNFMVNLALRAISRFPDEHIKNFRLQMTQSTAPLNEIMDILSLEKCSFDTIPFVWAKIKRRSRSRNAANILYRRSRILVTPGTAFGDTGEGFLRFSLTASKKDYENALDRIKKKIRLIDLGKDDER